MSRARIVAYLRRRAAKAQRDTLVPYEVDPAAYWREEDRRHWEKQAAYAQNIHAGTAAGSPDEHQEPQETTMPLDASIPAPSSPPAASEAPVSAPERQPAPPPPDQPSMAQTLEHISALIRQFLFCSEDQLTVLTLWIVHTYGFEYFSVTPYLNILSPESQSGKTVCMQLLNLLCHNAWMPTGVTPARLIKRITNSQPTLLLDNWNTLLRPADDQSIVGFLNAGSAHGNYFVTRDDDQEFASSVHSSRFVSRDDHQGPDKSVLCPKAFAGQGTLPSSLADRCIPIVLQRRKRSPSDLPFWPDIVFKDAFRLAGQIPSWMSKNAGILREIALRFLCDPRPDLSRHQNDAIAPLLAIAHVADGKWPRKSRYALYRILMARPPMPPTVGLQLLSDIRNFFRQNSDPPKIHTTPLLEYLNALEDRPWTEKQTVKKAKKKLTPESLARILQDFPVPRSRNQRIGDQYLKGYTINHFVESWDAYLPELPSQTKTSADTSDPQPVLNAPLTRTRRPLTSTGQLSTRTKRLLTRTKRI